MRRIDDLPSGKYLLELLTEERGGKSTLRVSSDRGGRLTGGAPRRILRVIGSAEEVEDERWESQASPGARFSAEVRGVGSVSLKRV